MQKLPFRFFRGEFNGYYVKAFFLSRNVAVQDILDELTYHAAKRWKLESEVGAGELPIRFEEMLGLASFAGVIRPVQFVQNTLGSVRFSSSSIVGGKERSERGLFAMTNEHMEYVRTEEDTYPDDITTEATADRRSTLVPEGATPEGYVEAGVTVFNEDGTIIPGSITATPPAVPAYGDYHGNKYLFFEEQFKTEVEMDEETFKAYYECIMRMRRSGESIAELLNICEILCIDYVKDIEITQVGAYYELEYTLNTASTVENRGGRLAAWLAIISKRFKDFVTVERAV